MRREVYDGTALAVRFDRDTKHPNRADYGWIGEDDNGVWITEPPVESLSERCSDLEAMVAKFWSGHRELEPGDYESLTAREHEGKLAMLGAHHRTMTNQPRKEDGD